MWMLPLYLHINQKSDYDNRTIAVPLLKDRLYVGLFPVIRYFTLLQISLEHEGHCRWKFNSELLQESGEIPVGTFRFVGVGLASTSGHLLGQL